MYSYLGCSTIPSYSQNFDASALEDILLLDLVLFPILLHFSVPRLTGLAEICCMEECAFRLVCFSGGEEAPATER